MRKKPFKFKPTVKESPEPVLLSPREAESRRLDREAIEALGPVIRVVMLPLPKERPEVNSSRELIEVYVPADDGNRLGKRLNPDCRPILIPRRASIEEPERLPDLTEGKLLAVAVDVERLLLKKLYPSKPRIRKLKG